MDTTLRSHALAAGEAWALKHFPTLQTLSRVMLRDSFMTGVEWADDPQNTVTQLTPFAVGEARRLFPQTVAPRSNHDKAIRAGADWRWRQDPPAVLPLVDPTPIAIDDRAHEGSPAAPAVPGSTVRTVADELRRLADTLDPPRPGRLEQPKGRGAVVRLAPGVLDRRPDTGGTAVQNGPGQWNVVLESGDGFYAGWRAIEEYVTQVLSPGVVL